MGEVDGKGKTPAISNAVMLEVKQMWFHCFSFGEGKLGEVLENLVAVAFEHQGVLVAGGFHCSLVWK